MARLTFFINLVAPVDVRADIGQIDCSVTRRPLRRRCSARSALSKQQLSNGGRCPHTNEAPAT
jgi:hypothetical protein